MTTVHFYTPVVSFFELKQSKGSASGMTTQNQHDELRYLSHVYSFTLCRNLSEDDDTGFSNIRRKIEKLKNQYPVITDLEELRTLSNLLKFLKTSNYPTLI